MGRNGDEVILSTQDKDKLTTKETSGNTNGSDNNTQGDTAGNTSKTAFVRGEWKRELTPEEIEKKSRRSAAAKKAAETKRKKNLAQPTDVDDILNLINTQTVKTRTPKGIENSHKTENKPVDVIVENSTEELNNKQDNQPQKAEPQKDVPKAENKDLTAEITAAAKQPKAVKRETIKKAKKNAAIKNIKPDKKVMAKTEKAEKVQKASKKNPQGKLQRSAKRRRRALHVKVYSVLRVIIRFFYEIGFYTEYAVVGTIRWFKNAAIITGKFLYNVLEFAFRPFNILLIGIWNTVSVPLKRVHRGFSNIRRVINDEKEKGWKQARKEALTYFKRGVKDYHHLASNLAMWSIALVALIVFIVTVTVTTNSKYVLELKVNDNVIGYVQNEETFEAARQSLESQMVYTDADDETWAISPQYSITAVGDNKVSNSTQVLNSILDKSGKDIKTATGLYVNNTFYGATTDSDKLSAAIEAIKAPYYDGDDNTTVDFVQDVQLVEGVYLADSVVDYSALDTLLGSTVQGEVNYVIQQGDTISGIASANGITQNELFALNPQLDNGDATYYPGDVLTIGKAQSFLQVKVIKRVVEQVAIPHGTTTSQSDAAAFGTRKVTVTGEDGSKDVTSDITYIDGVPVDKTIIEEVVTKESVTEEVIIGTYIAPGIQAIPGSGSMMFPVPGYRYMSRGFAGLYPAHNGVDICAAYGTPIYASDNGVVTKAAYTSTGYGVHVIINHGNGMSTVYGHCSALAVTTGQAVTKGQLIGYIGSTGWSTGNHCHFEVRINNVTVNPLNYVS